MFGTTFIKDNWDNLTSLSVALGLTGLLYGQQTVATWRGTDELGGIYTSGLFVIEHLPLGGLVTTISIFAILGGVGLYVASRIVPSIKNEVAKVLGGLFNSN